ncbi:hypothetical protein KRM28CT15_46220 [Krasilnikovia sp. M28-CT-15]
MHHASAPCRTGVMQGRSWFTGRLAGGDAPAFWPGCEGGRVVAAGAFGGDRPPLPTCEKGMVSFKVSGVSAAEESAEEPAGWGLFVVSGAALGVGHGAHDLVDVLAAAGPGGLPAGAAGY